MRLERSRILATCLPLTVIGCESLIGADFGSAKLAPPPDGGCHLVGVPQRPTKLQPASDTVDFTVVIHDLDFGDGTADGGLANPVGYDLDGLCSTAKSSRSCRPYPWVGAVDIDGPGGRDDAVGNLFGAQKSVLGGALIGSAEENAGVALGKLAPTGVLRVHGFSGFGNDDHVVVELFQVAAFEAGRASDAGPALPVFGASDEWPLVRATLADPDAGGTPRTSQRDENAYVLNGTLVAHFGELRLPVRNVYIDVFDAVVSADVDRPENVGWRLINGTLAAKIRTDSMLAFLPLATRSGLNLSLCTDDQLNYGRAKRFLCTSSDLPAVPGDVNSPCTFTSIAEAFQTSPASLGAPVDVVPPESFCPPETDPANDHCSIKPQ